MIIDGRQFDTPQNIEADVCIIGSGAGGAALAKELSESGLNVVILEAGGYFHRPDFVSHSITECYRLLYRNAGMTASLGKPGIPIPIGRCVGGTTVINSGTCFRTPKSILDKWREKFGLTDISEETLAPIFDRVEEIIHVEPAGWDVLGKGAEIIARGATKQGYTHRPLLRNVKNCQGSGRCCFGCPTDAKQSMILSYIPRALNAGVRLYSHCRVDEIHAEGGVVRSVSGRMGREQGKPGVPVSVHAKVIALCAGSLLSPGLLHQSRSVDVNRNDLGRHLTIHPATKVMALMDEEVRCWEGVPQGYCIDHFADQGIMFEGASVPPEYGSVALPFVGQTHRDWMEQYDRVAMFGFLVSDSPRGRVRPGPGGSPLIFYHLGSEEIEKIRFGIQVLCEIFFSAGAKQCVAPIFGHETVRSAADISALKKVKIRPNDLEMAAFHPLGTCRMGKDANTSVVDENLELHGVKNLFVVDGSVFPSSLGVNPQLTIMAFATRAAKYIQHRIFSV